MSHPIDFLIVGQGLAGTLLAYFLLKEGKSVRITDPGDEHSATRVAAGIINPITGRKFVKSWRVEELIPFAEATYRTIEEELGLSVYYPLHVIRAFSGKGEENDWLAKSGEPGYDRYMLDTVALGNYAGKTEPALGYGEVTHSGRVDIGKIAGRFREAWIAKGWLIEEDLDYDQLQLNDHDVIYGPFAAQQVIFCEGARAVNNPFFGYLPFRVTKGEVLIVRIPDAHFEKVLKNRVFFVPLGEDLYWIGATYQRQFAEEGPTEEGRHDLLERLQQTLTVPFEVVEHRAAIRPTVKDRRPFMGRHPDFPQLCIFNGLGTKGASLGPFWARHLSDFLVKNRILDPQVDIQRFING